MFSAVGRYPKTLVTLFAVFRFFGLLRRHQLRNTRAVEYVQLVDTHPHVPEGFFDAESRDLQVPAQMAAPFTRHILAQIRAKRGVLTYNLANVNLVRREAEMLIREARPRIRHTDVELHCGIIAVLAFVPSAQDVASGDAFVDQTARRHGLGWLTHSVGQLFGADSAVVNRIAEYTPPPK